MKKAVVGIVRLNNLVLLGKKIPGGEFFSGEWHIPGETKKPGEIDEDAVKRGIMEEAGIEVRVLRYLAQHKTPTPTLVKWYECEALSEDIRPDSDLEAVEWVDLSEVRTRC